MRSIGAMPTPDLPGSAQRDIRINGLDKAICQVVFGGVDVVRQTLLGYSDGPNGSSSDASGHWYASRPIRLVSSFLSQGLIRLDWSKLPSDLIRFSSRALGRSSQCHRWT